jgi:hypothetical protein
MYARCMLSSATHPLASRTAKADKSAKAQKWASSDARTHLQAIPPSPGTVPNHPCAPHTHLFSPPPCALHARTPHQDVKGESFADLAEQVCAGFMVPDLPDLKGARRLAEALHG